MQGVSASKRKTAEGKQSLPVPPRIIARVVEVAAAPDSTAADLASLIGTDPTLTAEVLRAVNSAHYGLRGNVSTVHHAVALMGMTAVRNLVLCIGVKTLLRTDDSKSGQQEMFWECSMRRAAASVCLANRLGLEGPDEYFTSGLCLDVGAAVMQRQDASLESVMAEMTNRAAAERLAAEREHGQGHDCFGADLLGSWGLPGTLSETVRFHHRPEEAPRELRTRCRVANAAEAIADLLQIEDKARALDEAMERIGSLGLDPNALQDIVGEVIRRVEEASEMLQLKVGEQPTYAEIVVVASDALLALSLARQPIERELVEHQQLAADLMRRNEELEQKAASDPLTNLANRGTLDVVLERDLAQTRRQNAAMTFLIGDIDHFKSINDRYGHPVGDVVLRGVSELLKTTLRRADLCARYGGEEFAMVLPFTDATDGQLVAERLRQRIKTASFEWRGEAISVTISIGGYTVRRGAESEPEAVIENADGALYRAKSEGRDRVCWCDDAAI
ncbi:MAG: GGDEF domain-containing protein [bacterium]|nr:GGDEF domain-containing protein [bacterium]